MISSWQVTPFLLAVLQSMYLVLFRLRYNLFSLSHSLILLNSVFIRNFTYPFCSYLENVSRVLERVVSLAYILKLNFD